MTITTAITCDNCGATGPIRGLVGWFQIRRHPDGIDTRMLGDDPRTEWDVCSTNCIKALTIR